MSFSKREWILFIIIISLLQGFVWYSAFVNAGNGSALNFISFAGTLVSIILAVLAIGYTYGESITQKNQSDTVVKQVSNLNNAIQKINIQADKLEQIQKISDSLTQYSKNVDLKLDITHEEVRSITELMSKFTGSDNVTAIQAKSITTTTINHHQVTQQILQVRTPLSEIAILHLISCEGSNTLMTLIENLNNLIEKARNEKGLNDGSTDIINIVRGAVFLSYDMLLAYGIIYLDSEKTIAISHDFKTEFLSKVREAPRETFGLHLAIRDELLNSID